MDKILALAYRFLFVVAFILAGAGVLEGVVQLAGTTLLHDINTAGRLFEFSGIVMVFVIALELRDIRSLARDRRV